MNTLTFVFINIIQKYKKINILIDNRIDIKILINNQDLLSSVIIEYSIILKIEFPLVSNIYFTLIVNFCRQKFGFV